MMKTVKEVAELTGISVRTLHYYDEIGLLNPTKCNEVGYRLYDDKALETLQQILFFREFDIPLKNINSIMCSPNFDKESILSSQKKMLELKRDRLNRLITSINEILKGENKMDLSVFNKAEIEELYQSMISNMSEEQKNFFIKQYGSMENYGEYFIENASNEKAQKNFEKVVEWYGDKESVLNSAKNTNSKVMEAYQKRIDEIMKKLATKRGSDTSSFEVKAIIGEYDFVSKQLYQLKDAKVLILELADIYKKDEKMKASLDGQYGAGIADFFAEAVEEFYRE
ncbi:MerR family transcriptional regulator [Anaerosporobacter sp.]